MPPRVAGNGTEVRAALASYAILGTPPEPQFDIFPELALTALDADSAALAFFDGDRMWIMASAGSLDVDARAADERLAHTFELGHADAVSGDDHYYCGAPVFSIDGRGIGVIGVFARGPNAAPPTALPLLEAISEAVTQALEARKRSGAHAEAGTRALFVFDAADWSVIFADEESMRRYNTTPATMQRLAVDDVFRTIDPRARRELDLLRDAAHGGTFAFTARALGALGFWNSVACSARMIRDKRLHSFVTIECAEPDAPARTNVHELIPQQPEWEEHRIESVLSKIEAGRQLLRGENPACGTAPAAEAFLSTATVVLAESSEPHLLAVFDLGPIKPATCSAKRAARGSCAIGTSLPRSATTSSRCCCAVRPSPSAVRR
jgi:hypothetical protein